MSKFVKVQTQLREPQLIKQALDDLKLNYEENARFVHVWSGFSGVVPFVVRVGNVQFGLRPTEKGAAEEAAYEVVADDMFMGRIRPQLAQIQQRYAYHAVKAATADAGFDLVEETVGRDQVIRLTVRRWS